MIIERANTKLHFPPKIKIYWTYSIFPIHGPHRPTFGHFLRIFNIFILHACGSFLQRAALNLTATTKA
jgi:hypothetical protein